MLAKWLNANKENSKTSLQQLENSKNSNPSVMQQLKRSREEESGNSTTAINNNDEDRSNKEQNEQIVKKSKNVVLDNDIPELEKTAMGKSWVVALRKEFDKPYFKQLKQFLDAQKSRGCKIFPPEPQIYSWSQYCALDNVKCVIIGQDPYHNVNQAHGLCFSVSKGIQLPPSLQNIFKELTNDLAGHFKAPGHGCLIGWAEQGVLLLNAVLTVEAHKANSHAGKGWEQFTDAVIKCVSVQRKNVVYMLWGNYAAKKAKGINDKENLLLKSVHPSPLSAHRGFFGSKHFSKANAYLEKTGQTPIDWALL